jgi:hypothetical protein
MSKIFIALFFTESNSTTELFINKVLSLNYLKDNIVLYIFNNDNNDLSQFKDANYKNIIINDESSNNIFARRDALKEFTKHECDYYLTIDPHHIVMHENMIQNLIDADKDVIGPLIVKSNSVFSNFWGALDDNGYYKRSDNYVDIVSYKTKGSWECPHIYGTYMIKSDVVPKVVHFYSKKSVNDKGDDPDMHFFYNLRETPIKSYINNEQKYGYMIDLKKSYKGKIHSELFMLFDNRELWEDIYLHPEFLKYVRKQIKLPDTWKREENNETLTVTEVEECRFLFEFPLFSKRFCKELIEEMEHFGNWSAGKDNKKDKRLTGGYENVPTQDIHLNQIGFEKHWINILKTYVSPVMNKCYDNIGFKNLNIAFVVKYDMKGQSKLKRHHDASKITTLIALNECGKDFEGGGTRFPRWNYDSVDQKVGWCTLHPGRLTHYHEGLPITSGERYIFVSFNE